MLREKKLFEKSGRFPLRAESVAAGHLGHRAGRRRGSRGRADRRWWRRWDERPLLRAKEAIPAAGGRPRRRGQRPGDGNPPARATGRQSGGEDGEGEDRRRGQATGKDGEPGEGGGGNEERLRRRISRATAPETVGSSRTGIEECSEDCSPPVPYERTGNADGRWKIEDLLHGLLYELPSRRKELHGHHHRTATRHRDLRTPVRADRRSQGQGIRSGHQLNGEIECRLGSEGGPGRCNDQFLAGKTVTLTAGAVGESPLEVEFSSSPVPRNLFGRSLRGDRWSRPTR